MLELNKPVHIEKIFLYLNILMRKTQKIFLIPYMQYSLDKITYINDVPKVVFICWFGQMDLEPEFTIRRYNALVSLITNIKVPVIFLTRQNYKSFEKQDFPYHQAFQYLSGNHKSDYLRAYMLHHYGGGYHDIKFRESSWENEWEKFKDPNVWMVGRREMKPDVIGHISVKEHYSKLATMGWIICKHNTPYTQELLNSINTILDKHLSDLILYPALKPRYPDEDANIKYPLRWLEIMGEIFHPIMFKYHQHIEYGLPDILYKTYK